MFEEAHQNKSKGKTTLHNEKFKKAMDFMMENVKNKRSIKVNAKVQKLVSP